MSRCVLKMDQLNSAEQFSGRKYINLESYKKSGEPKRTPVQSIENNGLLYVRTDPKTWKIKRIRGNPHVRVVPADRNGRPTGTWVDGEAHVVDKGEDSERIMKLFKEEYGSVGNSVVNLVGRMRGEHLTTVISIELHPMTHP